MSDGNKTNNIDDPIFFCTSKGKTESMNESSSGPWSRSYYNGNLV